jgi:hypothetical protein
VHDDDNPCAGENVLRKELRGAGSNKVSPEGMERERRGRQKPRAHKGNKGANARGVQASVREHSMCKS